MALAVTLMRAMPSTRHENPQVAGGGMPPHLDLYPQSFSFNVRIRLTTEVVSGPRHVLVDSQGRETRVVQGRRIVRGPDQVDRFVLPFQLPTTTRETIRIGIVQNVLRRQEVLTFTSGDPRTEVTDLNTRSLDTAAVLYRPFYADSYWRPDLPPQNPIAQPVPSTEAMRHLLVYRNGELAEIVDPWGEAAGNGQPTVRGSEYSFGVRDHPSSTWIPLQCDRRVVEHVRISQSQQVFLVLQRGGTTTALIATQPFTVFAAARIIPPTTQGQWTEGSREDHLRRDRSRDPRSLWNAGPWYSKLVPWNVVAESIPEPGRIHEDATAAEARLRRWLQESWAQDRSSRGLPRQRLSFDGAGRLSAPLRVGLLDQLRAEGFDTALVATGRSTNELLNEAAAPPCWAEFRTRATQWIEQQRARQMQQERLRSEAPTSR